LSFWDAVPYFDDWSVAMYTVTPDARPADWLWTQHNEHRIPLGRLVLNESFLLFGLDARPPMVLNVVLLAATAALALRTCRDLRGRHAPQDVAIPLLLAGLGHYQNVLWAFQLTVILAGFLFVVALRYMVRVEVAGQVTRPGSNLL